MAPSSHLLASLFLLLFTISFVSAIAIDNTDIPIVRTVEFDTNISVDTAKEWNTNLGNLSNVAAAQFNNVAGVLTIDNAWLDGLYCALTGCIMSGDINMGGNDLIYGGDGSSFNTTLLIDGDTSGNAATLVINSEINMYSCINLTEGSGNLGFQICNDGAGTNRLVISNADDGQEWFWIDRDAGTINFLNYTSITELNVTTIDITGDLTGTNVNISFLSGALGIGTIDMRGDPWYFSGADFQIVEDLYVSDIYASSINLTGNLNVTGNIIGNTIQALKNIIIGNESASAGFSGLGDLFVLGNLKVMEGMFAEAQQYGSGLEISDNDLTVTYTNIFTANATLNATSQILYDSEANFNSSYTSQFVRVITSAGISFAGATGEITEVIDSTHIALSFGSAGNDLIPDATGMSYIIYPTPTLSVLDNGDVLFSIGEGNDASFKVSISNGTNAHGVHIADVAGIQGHKAIDIEQDMNGYSSIGQNIYMYSSKQLVNEKLIGLLIEGDASNMNNSDGTFIDLSIIGSPLVSTTGHIDGIKMPVGMDHLIHVGSADTVKAVFDNEVNITSIVNHTNSGAEIFTDDNDYLYIGSDVNFSITNFDLNTLSSKTIAPEFYYCDGTNYVILSGAVDSTGGFTISGGVHFTPPSDWGSCNFDVDGTPFIVTTNYSYIAIKRTRNHVRTKPVLDVVGVSGATASMYLAEDLMRLSPVDIAPDTCNADILGAIYFDISENDMCVCKSTGWFVMTDGSACT